MGLMTTPPAPEGYATINPFLITRDVDGLITFLNEVFGAVERPEARTMDDDGLLLHAELALRNATLIFGERNRTGRSRRACCRYVDMSRPLWSGPVAWTRRW
jgi:uncharacterized glyoxalase superfamily protein PhnB